MASGGGDLLFHPVRMRIVLAMARGQRMTAQELGEMLADVPQPTLYRQLNRLVSGGLLEVVEERPVRGTVERVYALPRVTLVNLSARDLASATRDDLLRYFTTFAATLVGDFGRYLQRERVDLGADGVGFHQLVFYLSDEEFVEFARDLREVLHAALAKGRAPGRTRRAFTTVVMPTEEPPDRAPDATTQSEPRA